MVKQSVVVSVDVSDEDILDMIDTAGYGIGYWCQRAVVDTNKRQYVLTPDAEARENDETMAREFIINFDDIVRVLVEIAIGKHDVGYPREYAQNWFSGIIVDGTNSGDLDTDIMDCVIQICAFGEVVFG